MPQLQKVKQDIDFGIKAIEILFEEIQDSIDFAYLKGSATKPIESPIDYVPQMSDLDVHIKFVDDFPGAGLTGIDQAVAFALRYETIFREIHEDYFHMPRLQMMDLKNLEQIEFFTPPHISKLTLLWGDLPEGYLDITDLSCEKIASNDSSRILQDKEFLQEFPGRVYDRVGLDWWTILRRINWRVSPSPFRMLIATGGDPYQLWGSNRTQIVRKLRESGHNSIAQHYEQYYNTGWRLLESNFQDSSVYAALLQLGYRVIYECYYTVYPDPV